MKKSILLLSSLLAFTSCYAADDAAIDQFIVKKMKEYSVPGASIAIINHKKITYKKAYGYADLHTKRKMATDTLLQACSISKTITSLAVLLSFSKQHISIDDPANQFLTSWQIPSNAFTAKHPVTVLTLLNHSAGMINPYENFSFAAGETYPTNQDLLRGKPPAKNQPLTAKWVPGSKYEYCNGCYVVLQQVLEDVDHESFSHIMQSMVLTPLKMTNSHFDIALPYDHPDEIALPYSPSGKVYADLPFMQTAQKARYIHADNGLAVGGLWTTPSDLATFVIAIQNALAGNQSYVPRKIANMMVQPSSTKTRGLGFFINNKFADEVANGKYFSHGGFNQGYLAILIAGKTNGKGAVIMVNVSPDYHTKDKVQQWNFIRAVQKYIAQSEKWD